MTDLSRRVLAVIVIALALHPADPFAYIDPGYGSLLLQLLFGGFVGAAAIAKLYWRRIRDRLRGAKALDGPGVGRPGQTAASSRPNERDSSEDGA